MKLGGGSDEGVTRDPEKALDAGWWHKGPFEEMARLQYWKGLGVKRFRQRLMRGEVSVCACLPKTQENHRVEGGEREGMVL